MARARPAQLALDEDVRPLLGHLLAERGWNVVCVAEMGRTGLSDDRQLDWATREGRVLVTHNVADFARMATTWGRQGRQHCGLILLRQGPVGPLLRETLALLVDHPTADGWIDQVRWGSRRRSRR